MDLVRSIILAVATLAAATVASASAVILAAGCIDDTSQHIYQCNSNDAENYNRLNNT